MKNCIILLLVGLMYISCNREPMQNIEITFESLVLEFFEEGQTRGFNTLLSDLDITVEFGEVQDDAGGECEYRSNTVTINASNWDGLDEYQKRWLIFHELGHCLLDRRGHLNERIGNGECQSIMKGIEDGFLCTNNLYSKLWWDYYLDELFDESSELSDWYFENNEYSSFNTDSVLIEIDTFIDDFEFYYPGLSLFKNFKIDCFYDNITFDENSMVVAIDNISFQFCSTCTRGNAHIRINGFSAFRNQEGEFSSDTNSKLSIIRKDGNLVFFINDEFVHTFESDLWEEEGNLVLFTGEKTLNMEVVVSAIE